MNAPAFSPLSRPASSFRIAGLAPLSLALAGALLAVPALAAKPLIFCADASPEGFDPGLWDSSTTNNANRQMFQGLLAFKRGSTELVPRLATAWQMSPDAKTLTLTLRRGVQFHKVPGFTPSRAMNADDVLFTFGRFLNPEHPFNKAFPATFVYPQNMGLAQMVEGLDRVDEHTVRFRLKQ